MSKSTRSPSPTIYHYAGCGTCKKAIAWLVQNGISHGFIDYRAQPFEQAVKDVDVVFDTVGGKVQEASWSVLKPGGILVSIVGQPSEERAKACGARGAFVFIQPNAKILAQLAELVDAGTMRPIVGAEFALKDTAKAHALSQSGRAVGKIVLYVGQP